MDDVGAATTSETRARGVDVDAVVIGAGFAGLYMLHRLRSLGLTARVFEAAEGVGGTWFWNRYPGARCDSESHYYCFSFSEEMLQEWEWSSRYPEQPEILRYLNYVADKLDLRRDITFNTRVTGAHYDDARNVWQVETEQGERCTARFLITAVGCLSTAQVPSIKGLESFAGQTYHTGRWPHEGVDFTGKRVGILGTGSSGIQAIPVIAAQAEHLTVFQRTPNFSVPARNQPLTADEQRRIKEDYPEIWRKVRQSTGGFPFASPEQSALEVTPEERRRKFDELWELGGFRLLLTSYNDLILSKEANDAASEYLREKIREMVREPAVAEKLVPTSYPFGTKRPPIDTNYFDTFNRDNVTLVDLQESPIEEITAKGIRTRDKEYELDAIVFATGYDAMTGSLFKLGIVGRNGVALRDKWEGGPQTYLGVATAGFPNLFIITGPGSPSVLSNMPVSIEQHVEWIGDCIQSMHARGADRIEPTVDAEREWVAHVNEVANMTLYPQANSWYMGANMPGKPRVFLPYCGGVNVYREKCDEIAEKGYEGFEVSRHQEAVAA